MFGFDDKVGKANGKDNEPYIVRQVVLTEKLFGTGSSDFCLTSLQDVINKQVARDIGCILSLQLHQARRGSLQVETRFKQHLFLRG